MILLAPDETATYIPDLRPPRSTWRVMVLVDRVLEQAGLARAQEKLRVDFVRSHPRYQDLCRCRHHQMAHADGGEGACGAKGCECRKFRLGWAA